MFEIAFWYELYDLPIVKILWKFKLIAMKVKNCKYESFTLDIFLALASVSQFEASLYA